MKFNYDENPNTIDFWNGYYNARKVERKNIWLFDTVIGLLRGYAEPDAIEIGCGAGRTIIELWKLKKEVRWMGLDFSEVSIEKAIQKFGTRAKFMCADIVGLAHRSSPRPAFNFILCSETLEHISEPIVVCQMMWDWLRPSGTILITVPVARTPLDRGKQNLHHVKFQPEDFYVLFPHGGCEVFQIDKHHLAVVIRKGDGDGKGA